MNATFLQWFVGLHERCQRERTGATAWRMFRYQYERWLDGDATAAIPGLGASPPPPCGHERVPAGHGYRNLMRHIAVIQRYRLWMSRVESRRKSSLF
ncbi:MAG: hypothetical protein LBC18_03085 [Opitutaceae bacterium]|nr:hypothetical protein [Opitutaceae bacterium]